MPKHNKRQRKKSPPFLMLPRFVKRSTEFHGLSCLARAALIEVVDRYNGQNNGFIILGVRELADALGVQSTNTAWRALKELADGGIIQQAKLGEWRGQKATEWRLTWLRCDRDFRAPRQDWMPAPSATDRTRKCDRSQTKRQPKHSECDRSHANPKKTNNSKSPSATDRTHIDLPARVRPAQLNGSNARAIAALTALTGCTLPNGSNQ